jgi:acyl-CoA dehydrogenase
MNLTANEPYHDPYLTEERLALREMATRFTQAHIVEQHQSFEDAGQLPRSLHVAAAEAGLLGLGFPEEVGGSGGSLIDVTVRDEAMMEAGASSGLMSALFTHGIATPHIIQHGSDALIDTWVRPTMAGTLIGSLAITEPGAGSDVNNLAATAVRDGDHWVINGAKTYITSGIRADFVTTAVRTGGAGAGGISLIVVPTDTPGFTRSAPLQKMGWRSSDTAELSYVDVHVPLENMVGDENAGFGYIGQNFVGERIGLAIHGYSVAQRSLDLTVAWCRDRETFGRPLVGRQVVRHRLVEMKTRIEASKALSRSVVLRAVAGEMAIAEACLAKNHAVETAEWVCSQAVQLHGGMGYMTGTEVERQYRDVRLLGIGGGATEVLTDLASKLLGYG